MTLLKIESPVGRRRLTGLSALTVTALLIAASSGVARAQAPGSPEQGWGIGVSGGLASVQHVGAQIGVEFTRGVTERFSFVTEGAWMQDTVTRRREEMALSIASFLAQSQSRPAVFKVEAPAGYIGVGGRFFLTGSRAIRPYVIGTVGAARVTLQPTFSIDGVDVTAQLRDYHVTLGSDLAGSTITAAFSGGVGAQLGQGDGWLFDVGIRLTGIQSKGIPASNVLRLGVGLNRRF
jgi:hypothetical protein